MNKVISFSVYGTDPKYCLGAVRNIPLAKQFYPGWKIRFYVGKEVPKEYIDQLQDEITEIIEMNDSDIPGMYWRFLPLDDDSIDIFIVRDTDSRLSQREKDAVDVWISRDKALHVMRDHPHHNYAVMGGMWGYNKKFGRWKISDKLSEWLKPMGDFKKMDDMKFIARVYHDHIQNQNMVVHDDWSRCNFSEKYPTPRERKRFVGEIFDEHENPGPQCEML
jgi:hypothetical protein